MRIVDEVAVISVTSGVAARLEVVDRGFVRSRRGVRAVCATVLAWATMVAVTSAFDVADPLRITLFAAGAAFEDRGVVRSGTACPADVFVVCAGPPPFSVHPTRGTK